MPITSFPNAKDPADVAWYRVTFGEPLQSVVSAAATPISTDEPPGPADLTVTQPVVTDDLLGVNVLVGAGLPGVTYDIRVGVQTVSGSTIYTNVLLPVSGPSVAPAATHTITLPVNQGASWDAFVWPSKAADDVQDYAIDATAWLAAMNQGITSAAVSGTSGGITADGITYGLSGGARTSVTVRISAGTPAKTALVGVALTLNSGRVLNVLVSLPVRAAPIFA